MTVPRCTCLPAIEDGTYNVRIGWYKTVGSGTMTTLPSGSGTESIALDVGLPVGGALKVAGHSACGGNIGEDYCLAISVPCESDKTGTRWTNAGVEVLQQLDEDAGTKAYGIDNAARTVGYSFLLDPCRRRGVFWAGSSSSAPIDIGDFVAGETEPEHSWALAINNLTYPQVVGLNTDSDVGLLWENLSSSINDWIVHDLNESEMIGECGVNGETGGKWIIQQADDVNDYGHIAVWAFKVGSGSVYHALVLVPADPCPADINGSGAVNVTDLLALIGAWGACPQFAECIGDVNFDCVVGIHDLLYLIGQWGECGGIASGMPETVQDCIDICGLFDEECLDKCMEAVCINDPSQCE